MLKGLPANEITNADMHFCERPHRRPPPPWRNSPLTRFRRLKRSQPQTCPYQKAFSLNLIFISIPSLFAWSLGLLVCCWVLSICSKRQHTVICSYFTFPSWRRTTYQTPLSLFVLKSNFVSLNLKFGSIKNMQSYIIKHGIVRRFSHFFVPISMNLTKVYFYES